MIGMIERVGRAFARANFRIANGRDGCTDDCLLDPEELLAGRRIIEAMRDPTPAMLAAWGVDYDDSLKCWHAMIDAALEDLPMTSSMIGDVVKRLPAEGGQEWWLVRRPREKPMTVPSHTKITTDRDRQRHLAAAAQGLADVVEGLLKVADLGAVGRSVIEAQLAAARRHLAETRE